MNTKSVRVQGKCGACWAFSSTLSLAYRFCKLTHQFKEFSPQYSVSCDTNNYGCDCGTFEETWNFFESEGSISEKCFPYVSRDFDIPKCPQICKDGTEMKKYKIKEMSKESFNGPIEFKSELIKMVLFKLVLIYSWIFLLIVEECIKYPKENILWVHMQL